jgi:hypothetical protein
MTSATGSFASPHYPMPYHHNAECQWEIRGEIHQVYYTIVDLNVNSKSIGKLPHIDTVLNTVYSVSEIKVVYLESADML